MTQTFDNQFFKVNDNYPAMDISALGWIHPPKAWWKTFTLYVLAHFEEDLKRLGLHEAIRATCYGIQTSVANFYVIFELYCQATGTFFHSCRWTEHGFARDVGGLCLANGISSLWGILSLWSGVGATGEAGVCPVRDLPRFNVSLLHLLRCAWWLQGKLE